MLVNMQKGLVKTVPIARCDLLLEEGFCVGERLGLRDGQFATEDVADGSDVARAEEDARLSHAVTGAHKR